MWYQGTHRKMGCSKIYQPPGNPNPIKLWTKGGNQPYLTGEHDLEKSNTTEKQASRVLETEKQASKEVEAMNVWSVQSSQSFKGKTFKFRYRKHFSFSSSGVKWWFRGKKKKITPGPQCSMVEIWHLNTLSSLQYALMIVFLLIDTKFKRKFLKVMRFPEDLK